MLRGHNPRQLILRQAGLLELCRAPTQAPGIALIDGAVDTAHPALQGCRIARIEMAPAGGAGAHATFGASILLAGEAGRSSGLVMGLVPGGSLLNVACVSDAMLAARVPRREVARTLASAVRHALEAGCRVILFGVEIRDPESRDWRPLRDALQAAATAGAAAVFPIGNRHGAVHPAPCRWPEAIVVASCDSRGRPSAFSLLAGDRAGVILAPGEDIPGAGPDGGYAVRSGTSFAAAIAAGALALVAGRAPGRSIFELAAEVCRPPARVLDGTALA